MVSCSAFIGFEAYDGGRVPGSGVPIQKSDVRVQEEPLDNEVIEFDGTQVIVYFRAVQSDQQCAWRVQKPERAAVERRCAELRDLIHAEIFETVAVIFAIAFLAILNGTTAIQNSLVLLSFAIYLLFTAFLWARIQTSLTASTSGVFNGYGIAELNLILCSHGAELLSQDESTQPQRPKFFQVTVIDHYGETGYNVSATTLLGLRSLNDREYGNHFRFSVLPCESKVDFLLCTIYGLIWCISTTLLPCYKLNRQQAVVVSLVGFLIRFLVPDSSTLYVALIFISFEALMDFISFRHGRNFGRRITKWRDMFSVCSATAILISLYKWIGM